MKVGVCRVVLRITMSRSLKTKRRILEPLKTRLRDRFYVSVAEVGDNDMWQRATIGISYVNNDAQLIEKVLSKAIEFLEDGESDYEVIRTSDLTFSPEMELNPDWVLQAVLNTNEKIKEMQDFPVPSCVETKRSFEKPFQFLFCKEEFY